MKQSTIFKGFRFGLILQIAIGPICIYTFNIAIQHGFVPALIGVIGVSLTDALFILLAILGITAIVQKNEKLLKIGGTLILVAFGIITIVDALTAPPATSADVSNSTSLISIFIKAIVLTGANPLTIVFWSGVFSSKIVEEQYNRQDEIQFGIGAVLSTFISLTVVSIIGQFTSQFISPSIIRLLNVGVGLVLIYFGVKLSLTKK